MGSVIKVMDQEHLGSLIDRYAGPLVLYARLWCAAPEDVVQEAFIKLVQQARSPEQPVPWLYRVVRNGAISQARSVKRRQRHETRAAQQVPAWFLQPDDGSGLDTQTVTAAMEHLAVDQREIIVAHLWGGLTFEQIGELAGSSAATVYRRYAAGLAALRDFLGIICPTQTPK